MTERSPSGPWRPPSAGIDETLVKMARALSRHAPDRLGEALADWETRQQAELALRLPAADRLRLILHAPHPMRLVRSLPPADFYLTIREVGPVDAIPILSLASDEQITHLLDLEAWRGDRFDAERCGAWVALILEAGDESLRRFIRQMDDEMLMLLIHNWLHLTQIPFEDDPDQHGHGLGEGATEEGYMSPDGNHRFQPKSEEQAPAAGRFLRAFFLDQPERYQQILWGSMWELPSELEQEAHHWRQSRLDEKGFPAMDDALEIYAPPTRSHCIPTAPTPTDPDALAAPRLPVVATGDSPTFTGALELLQDEHRDDVLHGFVSVANHLLVADHADTGDPQAHRRAAEKAGAFVQIALQRRGDTTPERAAAILREIPVKELFREGYELPMQLHRTARALAETGWLSGDSRAIYLVDDEIRERFEALLGPRPMFLEADDQTQRSERREFHSLEEIETSAAAVEMIQVTGDILWRFLPLEQALTSGNELHRLSTFLLTLMAWHQRGDGLQLTPLSVPATADFLRSVASRKTASPDAPAQALERLLDELATTAALSGRQRNVLAAFGRFALQKLNDQCAGLDPGTPPDGRYVTCLWLEANSAGQEELS